ncbi:MAG: DinB family protein [Dehalococcoidia bacterium]|nr:DinB family protein [Dehalococcoidia bacterium]
MANRQALDGAFTAANARLDRLAPLIETYADDRLLDDGGKWSIRDCLCHIAATARVTGAAQRGLDRVNGVTPPAAPAVGAPTVDDRNQQQIEASASKSIAELIEETKAGHAAAIEGIRAMTDATLDTKIPDMQPTRPMLTAGGLTLRMLEYHEGGQLDRIENALRTRMRWL